MPPICASMATRKDARWALDGLEGVDVVVQPDEPRWKRLFVADMDSTIIGQECIDELADYAGLKDKVARITERAMRGELDFPGALRERVRLLAGLDERELKRCLDERVQIDCRRGNAGPDDAGRGRELPARVGRLPVFRQADRADRRVRPR